MEILLLTHKGLTKVFEVYLNLHKKYWGDRFTLIAEEDYSGGYCKFLKPPFDISESDSFTKTLEWSLNKIRAKYVIIMLSDYFITDPVNKKLIKKFIKYMNRNNVIRCEIGNNRGISSHGKITDTFHSMDVYEGFLEGALTPGIWHRKKLLEIISGNTAWSFENEVSEKIKGKFRSIGFAEDPIKYINGLRGGKTKLTDDILKQIANG